MFGISSPLKTSPHSDTREDTLDAVTSNALLAGPSETGTEQAVYKTYKRRWFGLIQLILLNIVISWGWLTYSPVVNDAATFFSTTPTTVNWLSTAFLLSFVAAAPVALYTLYHHGMRVTFVITASLVLIGNWIRYGGTRANPPSYGAVMVGQILIGLAQPFAISMPTTYSEIWFTARGRVAATAVATLANPFGGALGELVNPNFLQAPDQIPQMTLYVAIISTVASLPSFLIPSNPPTPVAPSSVKHSGSIIADLRNIVRMRIFWMILIPYSAYLGLFNSISSLLTQIMTPYGYSEEDASLAGGLLILVGLVMAAVTSPIVDRYKCYLLLIRGLVPIIALCYLTFYWAPPAGTLTAAYVICSVLGAASFVLVPVVLEALAEVTYPIRPSFSSVMCWTGGQLLGAIFIIISEALKDDRPNADPPGNLQHAMIFQAVVGMVAAPFAYGFGWRGGLKMRRLEADRGTSSR